MKKIFFLLIVCITTSSCTFSSKPEFKKIDNINPKNISLSNIEIEANAVFYNPNDIGCIVKDIDITVLVNGTAIGKTLQNKRVSISKKGDFSIPLTASFSPIQLLDNKKDIINGGLASLLSNEIEVQYLGNITVEKLGASYPIKIDKTENIKLKK